MQYRENLSMVARAFSWHMRLQVAAASAIMPPSGFEESSWSMLASRRRISVNSLVTSTQAFRKWAAHSQDFLINAAAQQHAHSQGLVFGSAETGGLTQGRSQRYR